MDIALDDGHVVSGEFLIVEGDAMPLLGKVTAEQLGILQVGAVYHVPGADTYRLQRLRCPSIPKAVDGRA